MENKTNRLTTDQIKRFSVIADLIADIKDCETGIPDSHWCAECLKKKEAVYHLSKKDTEIDFVDGNYQWTSPNGQHCKIEILECTLVYFEVNGLFFSI